MTDPEYGRIHLYARRAEEDAEDVPSLDEQIEVLGDVAETVPGDGDILSYRDETSCLASLRALKREGLSKLWDEADAGDLLMVWTLDRLSTMPLELTDLLRQLVEREITALALTHFEDQPLRLDQVMGAVWVAAMETGNELWEAEDAKKGNPSAHAKMKRLGFVRPTSSRPPVGRRFERVKYQGQTWLRVVWDEAQIKLVMEFDKREQGGESKLRIAQGFDVREEVGADGKPWVMEKAGKISLIGYPNAALKLMEHAYQLNVTDLTRLHPVTLEIQAETHRSGLP